MIEFASQKHHWNYFLAIEKDIESVSRFIEFAEANMSTYSIELTHILLSASSEVDVIMKLICKLLDPTKPAENINHYKEIIRERVPDMIEESVFVNRYGLNYKPWENWSGETNPDWWRSYNNVKHQRDSYFSEANLRNTINAVGALLIVTVYYYKLLFSKNEKNFVSFYHTTEQLFPPSSFIMLEGSRYFHENHFLNR